MAIDQDVTEALEPIRRVLDEMRTGIALFAARDNLETALFSAMQGMTDSDQIAYLETLTAHINQGT